MNICLDTRILEEIAAGNKEQKEWLIGTDINIATLAGKIQYKHRFGIGDSIITATAKRYKCSFIRTDQKEFEKVKGIKTRW